MLSIWTKQYLVQRSYIVQNTEISCNILAEVPAVHFGFSKNSFEIMKLVQNKM
jgi:hypothetical protein